MVWSLLWLLIDTCERNLTFAILQFLSHQRWIISWLVHRLIINETSMLAWPLLETWVLLWMPIKRLLQSSCHSIQAKANSRFISGTSACRLYMAIMFLRCLEHRLIGCRIVKCANDWFLNGELLHRVRRISCQSQLCNLWGVSQFWVWVVWCCRLLRTEFVVTLSACHIAELEGVLVRGSLDVNEQSRSVVYALLVVRSQQALLVAAPRVVVLVEHHAAFARRGCFPVAQTLLGWGLLHLLLVRLLRLLVREALVVSVFELLIEALHLGEGHSCHLLELTRIYYTHFRIPSWEGDDCACEEELVYIEETLLLNAEIREEFSISP